MGKQAKQGVCNHHHLGNGGKSTCDTLKYFGTVMRLAILVTHKQRTKRNKQGKANQDRKKTIICHYYETRTEQTIVELHEKQEENSERRTTKRSRNKDREQGAGGVLKEQEEAWTV